MFSLLPRFLRPRRIIADAFISIYDTAVADRELIKRSGLLARFLKALERRAYTTATLTTVDTDESRDYYAELFDLPRSKFVPVPLATDEDNFCDAAYSATSDVCNVLFVGTFVPLQGTDVIARAIVELKDSSDISFTIVGSGQCAAAFADILDNPLPNNMTWIQEWQDSASVAAHIRAADICLGVFSDGLKAERVWPFKNYAYMACGRALVTADTTTARRMLANDDSHPFVTIPAGDALALAAKIVELADAPEFRSQLARKSRRYYDRHLSNTIVRDQLIGKLFSA
jgi:glycosyltransferase involved in cell wall biosynthesis